MMSIASKHTGTAQRTVFFPNLNGVRFIAAMLVVIDHIESMKLCFLLPNRTKIPFFYALGKLGVVLFFVLSGFLITYLLLTEQQGTRTISIKQFYTRRILRIWPLYFLIVIFALWVAPHLSILQIPYFESCLGRGNDTIIAVLMFGLCSNGVLAWYGSVPFAVQAWSIGTEEQFYLIWPWLVKKCRNKLVAFIAVIAAYNGIKYLLMALQPHWPVAQKILDFWYYFNIDCMAIGAIAAYLLFAKKELLLKWIFHPVMQWGIYAIVLTLIGFGIKFPYFHFEIFSLLFAIILLNLAANPKSVVRLQYPWLDYLGKISYGIYMYHFIAITLVLHGLTAKGWANDWLIYPGSIGATILLSALSYHGFEIWFLRMKPGK
jgi:peptidoglycan/LPS O-acetylase OafA/YrhL